MASEADPAQALWSLLSALRDDLGIDRAGVFAFDPHSRLLERVVGVDPEGQPEFDSLKLSLETEGALQKVARREMSYYVTDDLQRDFPGARVDPRVRAHAIVPIIAGDEFLGALCVDNCRTGLPIPESLVEPLFLYAALAALPLFALYQKKERERTDAVRWKLMRDVFRAATSGKVQLCDPEEIRAEWPILETAPLVLEIRSVEDLPRVREAARGAGLAAGMTLERARDFELCVAEAATNALIHGHGGFAAVASDSERVRVRVTDTGRGISLDELPGATLQPGWSKRRTMGLGFTLINETADRVYLHTGPEGTTIIIELAVVPGVHLPDECNPLLWGEAFSF